jgi:hypothetical protein
MIERPLAVSRAVDNWLVVVRYLPDEMAENVGNVSPRDLGQTSRRTSHQPAMPGKGNFTMSYAASSRATGPWWREPTKDQWYAFIAAWLGWTLDAFDFTVFLFLLVPIAKEFHADLALVVPVVTLTMLIGR